MSNRRVESFLLRLVVNEKQVQVMDEWCGRVQHVSSGYERQFDRLQDLIEFINAQMINEQSMLIVCDEQLSVE